MPQTDTPGLISRLVAAPKKLYNRTISPAVGFLVGKIWLSDENEEDDDMLELPDDEFGE